MERKKRTFGGKLYSMFMGSVLIPSLLSLLCFGIYSSRTLIQNQERNGQDILNSVSQTLEMQFSDIINIQDAFYIYNEVFQEAEALNNPQLYQYYDELTRIEMENTYTIILTKLIHTSDQDIRAVVFFPASNGDTAYYLGKENARLEEIEYPGYHEETWYKEAAADGNQSVFYAEHNPEYIENRHLSDVYSYIKAVRDMSNGNVIGVVKIDVSSQMLEDTLNVVEQTADNGLIILQEGEFFASSEWIPAEQEMTVKEGSRVQIGKKLYQMQTREIAGTGLELVYLNSRGAVYRGYLPIIAVSLLILLGGVILAFVNYRRQAKKIVGDVQLITEALQRVEKGDLDTEIQIREESEFKEIAAAINHMMSHLKAYIEKEYMFEIQQQKAEYRALQSQINPHFLYNTLNGFVALNRMGEKKILERSIIGLSRLFRYACSSRESVTLQEEISFLEEYLKLEKLKYEERLEYMVWTDEESRQKVIPKLLLQPVVENSIKHGMRDDETPMLICIMTETKEISGIGKVTVITVRDNGIGFDSRGRQDGKEHVGVENVRTRAELFCHDAIFQCTSEPGKGTKTTLVFPFGEQEDK